MFCGNCGTELVEGARHCSNCGAPVGSAEKTHETSGPITSNDGRKSKLAAGLFGIFLGSLGVHNFYLGYTMKGVIQLILLILGFITCGITSAIAGIWGLVEGILILAGNISADANGVPLRE